MDDRIGDLLAERTRLGGNAAGGIAVSVFLHGVLAAGIVYAAMHAAAPQEVSTLNIRFAPAAGVGSGVSGMVTPPPGGPPPAPKKMNTPQPRAEQPKAVAKSGPKTGPLS